MRKNTKTNDVYEHLKKYGRINTMEAYNLYGATRLSAIIFNLRNKYDISITNESVKFVDRNGRKSHFDNYVLVEYDCFNEDMLLDEDY